MTDLRMDVSKEPFKNQKIECGLAFSGQDRTVVYRRTKMRRGPLEKAGANADQ